MKVLNHFAISIAFFGIIGATFPNIAVASSSEEVCRNAVRRELNNANFGSDQANSALVRPIIIRVATPKIMNTIRLSNQGRLRSSRQRRDYMSRELVNSDHLGIVKDPSKVSYVANSVIESLLADECRGVR